MSTSNNCTKLVAFYVYDGAGIVGTETAHPFGIYTSNTERMRIDSSGNMGLGTASPDANLHIKGGYPTVHIERDSAINYSRLLLDNTANDGGAIDGLGDGVGGLRFSTSDAGTITERLRIDNSGRMMLGTTTEGAADADNLTIADSGDCGITIRTGTTSTGSIYFSDATSGAAEADGFIDYNQSSRYLRFATEWRIRADAYRRRRWECKTKRRLSFCLLV